MNPSLLFVKARPGALQLFVFWKLESIFADVKKAIIAILAFLYLGLAGGIVMNIHYCMGQLSAVDYGDDERNHCSTCGMKEDDGCCSSELKVIKLQDSHQWAKPDSQINKDVHTIALYTKAPHQHIPLHYRLVDLRYHSPPDNRANLVFLYTSVFRI